MTLTMVIPALTYDPSRKNSLWEQRYRALRDAGVTREQAELVWQIVDDARGHHTQWLAEYAHRTMVRVYTEQEEGS